MCVSLVYLIDSLLILLLLYHTSCFQRFVVFVVDVNFHVAVLLSMLYARRLFISANALQITC